MSAVERWLRVAQDHVWEDELVSPPSPRDSVDFLNETTLSYVAHILEILSTDTQGRVPRTRSDKKRGYGVYRALFRRQHPVILRRQDFIRLKQTPKPPNEQLAILLGMNEGFRRGEIVAAQYEDLLPEDGVVYVHDSKDYRTYPLPMDREVFDTLLHIPEKDRTGYVLKHKRWTTRRDKAVGAKWMWDLIKRLADESGVLNGDEWTWTYLRVFFAKEWIRERVEEKKAPNIPMLSALMRHSDPSFTWRYIKKFWYVEDVQKELRRFQLGVQPMREMLVDIEK